MTFSASLYLAGKKKKKKYKFQLINSSIVHLDHPEMNLFLLSRVQKVNFHCIALAVTQHSQNLGFIPIPSEVYLSLLSPFLKP